MLNLNLNVATITQNINCLETFNYKKKIDWIV